MRPVTVDPRHAVTGIDAGPPPMLQWLPIDRLVVDDSYQRSLKEGNWKAIRRIAGAFSWSRFSPVFVAPIPGGRFAIIDGQHRVHAAALCGHSEVPCQVVQMTHAEQAAAFAAVNGMTTKVSSGQIYKAALAAGEDWARTMHDCAAEAGCKVMTSNQSNFSKKPGEIYALKQLRELIATYGRPNVTRALSIMMRAQGYRDDYEAWDAMIMRATAGALCSRASLMTHPKIVQTVEEFPLWETIDDINTKTRDRIRRGLPYVAKKEQLLDAIIAWLDRQLKAPMALPSSAKATA